MSDTDPTTEQMQQESGHNCLACPSAVRNLYAAAYNLLNRLDSPGVQQPWDVRKKAADLRSAVESIKPVIEEHFAALDAWRKP